MKQLLFTILIGVCVCHSAFGQGVSIKTQEDVLQYSLQETNYDTIAIMNLPRKNKTSNWSFLVDFNLNPFTSWALKGDNVYRWGLAMSYRIPYTPWATNKKFQLNLGYYRQSPNDFKTENHEKAININHEDPIYELMTHVVNIPDSFYSVIKVLQFDVYQHVQTFALGLTYPIWEPSKGSWWSGLNLSLDLMYNRSTQSGNNNTYELRFFAAEDLSNLDTNYVIPADIFGEINIAMRNNWVINIGIQTELKIWNRNNNSINGLYLGVKLNGLFPMTITEDGLSVFSVDEDENRTFATGYFSNSRMNDLKDNIQKIWYPMVNGSFQLIYKF